MQVCATEELDIFIVSVSTTLADVDVLSTTVVFRYVTFMYADDMPERNRTSAALNSNCAILIEPFFTIH